MIRALTLVLFALGLFQKGLTSVIQSVDTVEEAVGEDALLSCQILQSENVVHVAWLKQTQDGGTNLATLNNIFGSTVNSGFRGKVEVIGRGLHNSSIVIKNVTEEDEGCYLCLFITNSAGTLTCRTCLRVYELHEPVLHVRESKTTDEVVVSCSATGRPAPTVTLTQQDLYLSQNNTVLNNTNATVTVTATAVLAGFHDAGTRVGCAVQVLSHRKEASVLIPDVKLTPTSVGTWIVGVACLCTASVFAVLLIRRLRSSPSHRDLEKTEVPQTADTDTVRVPLFTPEKSPVREQSPPSESKQRKETDPESSSKARSLQSDHPSHRDLEKTEVPQTADTDTIQENGFKPEKRKCSPSSESKPDLTDLEVPSKRRRLQSDQSFSPSHRDLEKTEVPQTADTDTVRVPLFTPEKRTCSPSSESKPDLTDLEFPLKSRRLQSDQISEPQVSTESPMYGGIRHFYSSFMSCGESPENWLQTFSTVFLPHMHDAAEGFLSIRVHNKNNKSS